MRRLPWGVYLALWSCAAFLLASPFNLWWGYPSYFPGRVFGDSSFWVMLENLPETLHFINRKIAPAVIWRNVGITLIILGAGAAVGLLVRLTAKAFETKRG